jgi:hypothetical protein
MLKRRTQLKRTPFRRKPPKDRTVIRAGREICEGQAWQERRKECHDRAGGYCECGCTRWAPLHDVKDPDGRVRTKAGEAHHKRKRGMGGGFRDDSLANLQWLYWECHDRVERPRKVVPRKVIA